MNYYQLSIIFGRAPASQGRHLTGFASLGASHASPLQAAHAKTLAGSVQQGFCCGCLLSFIITANDLAFGSCLFFEFFIKSHFYINFLFIIYFTLFKFRPKFKSIFNCVSFNFEICSSPFI